MTMLIKQHEPSGSTLSDWTLLVPALNFFMKALFISAMLLCVLPANAQVRIERPNIGIQAELEDQDDYFYRPDGSKVKFYRKKNVFVVRNKANARAKNGVSSMQRFKAQFGDRVKAVKGHRLGSANVVQIDNSAAMKAKTKKGFDINPKMLQSLDSNIAKMEPVFASDRGKGDLLLLPRITLSLVNGENAKTKLASLTKKYNLSLVRRLRVSGHVYSLALNSLPKQPSQQFTQVRNLMNESSVAWAEPQFFVKATKAQYVPNDEFYDQQWHLQDNGFRGSRCDTDCDANDAWNFSSTPAPNNAAEVGVHAGEGIVVAVLDDGVQLDHPDLANNIFVNAAELGLDEDNNGFVNDVNGYDFVDDQPDVTVICGDGNSLDDGTPGEDADPSPRATGECVDGAGEPFDEDNHGTAIAGIIAAQANTIGVSGVAFNAEILPVRIISDFDDVPFSTSADADYVSFCDRAAEAMEYSARFADVINASWTLPFECAALNQALENVTKGTVSDDSGDNVSKRPSPLGSPVIFPSGNDGSGWVKVTIPVSAGNHAYEWRYLRNFSNNLLPGVDDAAWLDDIAFPSTSGNERFENFESFSAGSEVASDFTNEWTLNSCAMGCDFFIGDEESLIQPTWQIESDLARVFAGNRSARIQYPTSSETECGYSYLNTMHQGPAGDISFWVWVSAQTNSLDDTFEFLIDGEEVLSYGDIAASTVRENSVAYPANLSDRLATPGSLAIAVGASGNGDLDPNDNSADPEKEYRAPYSQFGTTLDIVAPGLNQHTAITTTDRVSANAINMANGAGDTDGYNVSGSSDDLPDARYTQNFGSTFVTGFASGSPGGTSASAAIVSGVAATMIAVNPALTVQQVKDMLRDSADKIGRSAELDLLAGETDRNDFHGHGRVNMYRALQLASGDPLGSAPAAACSPDTFDLTLENDFILSRFMPEPTAFCAAEGPLAEPDDQLCVPIRATNGNIALICL